MPDDPAHNPSIATSDGVTTVHLDDGRANAITPAIVEAMRAAVADAATAGTALLISGRPGRFCAGFDLATIKAGGAARDQLIADGRSLLLELFAFERPVVVACTGHALAAGAGVLAVADWRVGATGDFRLGFNEVAIGLAMSASSVELIRHRFTAAAMEAVVRGDVFDPAGAVAAGLLDEVVDPDELVSVATAAAGRLAALDPGAFALSKQRVRAPALAAALAALDGES